MASSDTNPANVIPVIDLTPLDLSDDLIDLDPYKDLCTDDAVVKKLAEEVVKAFSDIGFCYLVNHAISKQSIGAFNKKTGEFFELPSESKNKYRHHDLTDPTGWQDVSEQKLDKKSNSVPEDKQVYNICPSLNKLWPEKEIPGFKDAVLRMYHSTERLCLLLLKLLGIGLKLENPDYFLKVHDWSTQPSLTAMRACYYPPVAKDIAQKAGTMRCGAHSDWGSLSFVYQEDVGGLQVMTRGGEYIPAPPIQDSVLVNVGDMMQRWTADKFISTKHRVVISEEDFKVQHVRRLIAFFAMPLNEVNVECLDGSNKYPPISYPDYKIAKLANVGGNAVANSSWHGS